MPLKQFFAALGFLSIYLFFILIVENLVGFLSAFDASVLIGLTSTMESIERLSLFTKRTPFHGLPFIILSRQCDLKSVIIHTISHASTCVVAIHLQLGVLVANAKITRSSIVF